MLTHSMLDAQFQHKYGWTPPEHQDRRRPGGRDEPDFGGHEPHHYQTFQDPDRLMQGWHSQEGWHDHSDELAPHIEKTEKHLQSMVDKGHPCIRVPSHVVHKVLESGRFKSQFETGSSGGTLDPTYRALSERAQFGYPTNRRPEGHHDIFLDHDESDPEHPVHARPIYGYLAHDPIANDKGRYYGEHTLVLHKPTLWHRTSVTMGDSLAYHDRLTPRPAESVDIHTADADPMAHYTFNDSNKKILKAKLKYHQDRTLDGEGSGYTEAQFHGGVPASAIHYAVLRHNSATHFGSSHLDETKAALTKHGIPWIHVGMQRNPGTDHFAPGIHSHGLLERVLRYQAMLVASERGTSMDKVVATRGAGIYLIQNADGQGQVADTRTGELHPPQNLQSILARGYWEDCGHVDIDDVLALVKPV
jgi:hypothetical protein